MRRLTTLAQASACVLVTVAGLTGTLLPAVLAVVVLLSAAVELLHRGVPRGTTVTPTPLPRPAGRAAEPLSTEARSAWPF